MSGATAASTGRGDVLQRLPRVMIYRDSLGMGSETFIYAQASAMRSFEPHFLGLNRGGQLPLPTSRTKLIEQSPGLPSLQRALFKFCQFSPRVNEHLRGIAPALIHAHFGPDAALIAPFARANRIPLVVTFHGYDATIRPENDRHMSATFRLYRRRTTLLKESAALVVAVSDFIRSRLLQQGYPAPLVHRHYIGIDLEVFKPDPSIERERIVLFAARLVEKKGCAYLIDAMAAVQAAMPDIALVVIGDGPLRATLERRAEEKRVRVQFLGAQPPNVVRDWMRRATVFSVPSVSASSGDAEGFGMVFAEAAAVGTPVASYRSGGIPEVVQHGVSGLLANEADVGALATNIKLLVSDNALRSRMSRAGIERVKRLFDIRQQTRELEDAYRAVLSMHSARTLRIRNRPESPATAGGSGRSF